jgi:hypothetical protein
MPDILKNIQHYFIIMDACNGKRYFRFCKNELRKEGHIRTCVFLHRFNIQINADTRLI